MVLSIFVDKGCFGSTCKPIELLLLLALELLHLAVEATSAAHGHVGRITYSFGSLLLLSGLSLEGHPVLGDFLIAP